MAHPSITLIDRCAMGIAHTPRYNHHLVTCSNQFVFNRIPSRASWHHRDDAGSYDSFG
jgi:hypothetical protein